MPKSSIALAVITVLLVGGIVYYYQNKPSSVDSYAQDVASTTPQLAQTGDTQQNTATISNNTKAKMITLTTNMGTITIELMRDEAPKTTENFVKLASSGFYDGTKFHRVIKGFMIQGGDPQSKDATLKDRWGTGGPGYQFADEINPSDAVYTAGYDRGIVAMANSGPNTNGSQFFIMHQKNGLPPLYTIFGKVTSGMDVVDKIANVSTYMPGRVDRPMSDVIIEKVTVQ